MNTALANTALKANFTHQHILNSAHNSMPVALTDSTTILVVEPRRPVGYMPQINHSDQKRIEFIITNIGLE